MTGTRALTSMGGRTYSSDPMYALSWADPHVDLENPRFVISVEWTWPDGDENEWTHFSLVRSTRSPVRRREEGQVMMETPNGVWDQFARETSGLPVYRDPQPPPGEWVFYTAFVLNTDRVWVPAGFVYEIGIADYDWALRLPEILPGVSIADTTRTASPAEQSNTLVQFLQIPGALLDKVVTMGEAAQHFWDPLKVPPQMMAALVQSTGYSYEAEPIGLARGRYVMDALMGSQQGSIPSIQRFVEGVTGCWSHVEISNNHMLDINDSSFESGSLTGTKWAPTANLELREYVNYPDEEVNLHPNVMKGWFLYLKAAGTYTCGVSSPVTQGIPVATWTKARMGCYALAPSATVVNLTMGLKLYNHVGTYLRDVTVLTSRPITQDWAWYGNADASAVDLGNPDFAYAVPWVQVSNACSVDLIVVDDG